MLAGAQLALDASESRDVAAARTWLGHAMGRADDLHAQAADTDQLDVLKLAADLTVSMGALSGAPLVADLPRRLEAASKEVAARHEPALRTYERWFEIYDALMSPAGAVGDGATVPAPAPALPAGGADRANGSNGSNGSN